MPKRRGHQASTAKAWSLDARSAANPIVPHRRSLIE